MLREFSVTQPSEVAQRRWWVDDDLDLIVWLGSDSSLLGFRLCYNKFKDERALTWTVKDGYSHHRVDSGESNPTKNRTPILVEDGPVDGQRLRRRFLDRSEEMDPAVRRLVVEKLSVPPTKAPTRFTPAQ